MARRRGRQRVHAGGRGALWDEEAPIAADITAAGGINIKKTTQEVSMPSDAEELRDRLRIWGASWVFAASRFPSKPVLGEWFRARR